MANLWYIKLETDQGDFIQLEHFGSVEDVKATALNFAQAMQFTNNGRAGVEVSRGEKKFMIFPNGSIT